MRQSNNCVSGGGARSSREGWGVEDEPKLISLRCKLCFLIWCFSAEAKRCGDVEELKSPLPLFLYPDRV